MNSLLSFATRILVAALVLLPLSDSAARAAGLEAGVARTRITPPQPFWMSGYAARTHPSEGIQQELWAKALAVRDSRGHRAVVVTTDLIGLPRHISDEVAARAQREFRVERSQLLLNSSHTHSGPAVGRNLSVMFDFSPEEAQRVTAYSVQLTDQLVRIIGESLLDLAPAHLSVGHGLVGFAANRRQSSPNGYHIGVNPLGPVDHEVPVLKVSAPDGRLRAVLFGYACHNTTLGGDLYQINGDYAGYAQAAVEAAHPGATALFLMLCGGDQNPNPRGTVDHVVRYGEALAAEVSLVLARPLRRIRPPLRTASETIGLDFAPHTREQFEAESTHEDRFRQRRARLMIEAYDAGQPVRNTSFPVQAIRFGKDLTLLALGGEVVIDYALASKGMFPRENLVVAGYCHDVACYIPSRRVLREGGYEAVESMIYYGQPGPFAESVEEVIHAAIRRVMTQVGARAGARPAFP
ncbi:MAG: neutral/alkaline non-lysosomal ceramidase N-terminal domain-containing protein [Limisphaerales bacterium]